MTENPYEDIIHLPRIKYEEKTPMSFHDRASQFASFKALNGYEESIGEAERLTDKKEELSDEEKFSLDEALNLLRTKIKSRPETEMEYFIPDSKKNGGKYVRYKGKIRHIDEYKKQFVFVDGTVINFYDVCSIKIC